MASGTIFTILRNKSDNNVFISDEVILEKVNSFGKEHNFNFKEIISVNELHRYHALDESTFIDIKEHKFVESIFSANFCSSFTAFAEYFNLNAYSLKYDQEIITLNMAKEILQALKYLLNEQYSKSFENILNNPYVKIFSDYSYAYYKWKNPETEAIEDEFEKYYLIDLHDILSAYILFCTRDQDEDPNKFVLLCIKW